MQTLAYGGNWRTRHKRAFLTAEGLLKKQDPLVEAEAVLLVHLYVRSGPVARPNEVEQDANELCHLSLLLFSFLLSFLLSSFACQK